MPIKKRSWNQKNETKLSEKPKPRSPNKKNEKVNISKSVVVGTTTENTSDLQTKADFNNNLVKKQMQKYKQMKKNLKNRDSKAPAQSDSESSWDDGYGGDDMISQTVETNSEFSDSNEFSKSRDFEVQKIGSLSHKKGAKNNFQIGAKSTQGNNANAKKDVRKRKKKIESEDNARHSPKIERKKIVVQQITALNMNKKKGKSGKFMTNNSLKDLKSLESHENCVPKPQSDKKIEVEEKSSIKNKLKISKSNSKPTSKLDFNKPSKLARVPQPFIPKNIFPPQNIPNLTTYNIKNVVSYNSEISANPVQGSMNFNSNPASKQNLFKNLSEVTMQRKRTGPEFERPATQSRVKKHSENISYSEQRKAVMQPKVRSNLAAKLQKKLQSSHKKKLEELKKIGGEGFKHSQSLKDKIRKSSVFWE